MLKAPAVKAKVRDSLDRITKFPKTSLIRELKPRGNDSDAPKAVVIGAGFGGLAAAIRLLARGYRVEVIDRLDVPGGRARVHHIDGYTFDAGPTVITAPFLLEELWQLAGRRLEDDLDLRPVSPFYQIRFDDGTVFDYTGDPRAMRSEVAKLSPNDVAGYEAFVKQSEAIFKVGFETLAHAPFNKPQDMLRIVPAMLKLESYKTVYGLVAKYVKNEKLRQVMSFHPLLVGGNPFATSSIYTLIAFLERRWGVHFAMGGTGKIIEGMVKLIEDLGGIIRLGTGVDEITVEDGKATGVRLSTAETVPADIVVSNGDSAWTYRYLIDKKHRRKWPNARIENSRYSMSLFVWYFGTSKKYDNVEHHTILLGPRYKGLLSDIFNKKTLSDDFSLYLHRPTKTDPSMAPEGCDAFYVLSPVPHLDADVDWSVQAERYRESIATYLEEKLMPGLRENITASKLLTPIGFETDYLSYKGAAFSFEPVLWQSAYLRPHNKSEDVDNLFFVGAGTHPGAGMPGVLSSARVLDTVVPDVAEFKKAQTR